MRFIVEARRRKVIRTAGLYVVAAAGIWGAAEVAFDALGLPSQALTAMVRNPPTFSLPRRILWSPDGSEIWFMDFEDGDLERPVWRAAPFEGGDVRDLRSGSEDISPSPDGERVILPDPILLGKSNVLKPNLKVLSLVTGEETGVELEDATGLPVMVDWSPDGDHVAVLVSDWGTDLYLIEYREGGT